jgi:hypothetical protein
MKWWWRMKDEIHVHIHLPESMDRKLDLLLTQGAQIMTALERVTQEVEETKTAVESITTLLGKLAQMIRDSVGNAAALNKLADDLDAQQVKIADAVVANTPAEEPPPETPA